jgi:cytochrome c oxidase subunit 3
MAQLLPSSGHGNGREAQAVLALGPFGLTLFLVSLGVLFLGGLAAYALVRARAPAWPPPAVPPLPQGLWISTGLLVAASGAIEVAARAVRAHRPVAIRAGLAGALACALAFLASQTVCWLRFVFAQPAVSPYGRLFLFLTGLHAAHVVGGVVPVVIFAVDARAERLPAPTDFRVRACATYWHFLAAVWAALFSLLLWSR